MIVAVNGDSFVNMSHEDAVRYLSSLRGSIRFELQNTIEADIEAVCDMESRYYDLYDVSIEFKNPLTHQHNRVVRLTSTDEVIIFFAVGALTGTRL